LGCPRRTTKTSVAVIAIVNKADATNFLRFSIVLPLVIDVAVKYYRSFIVLPR
jgi:AAA+ ATPase superfamily predicted ATPase